MTNNKQQTAVKLYTEEQVRQMLIKMGNSAPLNIDYLINEITPIELPSDEEILKNGIKPLHGLMDEWDKGFLFGAKLMHFLIQGGNK